MFPRIRMHKFYAEAEDAMILEALWHQIAFALIGGVAAEALHWYALSRKPEKIAPYNKNKKLYWTTTVVMVALGGLMPVLYLRGAASALLCFHLGLSAPVLLQKLVSTAPTSTDHLGPGNPSFKRFLSW
jgi:hypothetical protein